MELRELKYFLAVASEESISKAAQTLFITQPNLSRQMQNLEDELGEQLFVRGNRKITLTEAGKLLRKRAEEIVELANKIEVEVASSNSEISGDICIGSGESYAISTIINIAKQVQDEYPKIKFHIHSGDGYEIAEKLDKGLIDFGIFIGPYDLSKYEYLKLPLQDTWGVIMQKDNPLALKDKITPQDLWNVPIIRSKQSFGKNKISEWFKKDESELNIVATYNLLYNASIMVEEGLGVAVSIDKLLNTSGDSNLCFRPLYPELKSNLNIAWKKHQIFPKCTEIFLDRLKKVLQ